MGNPGYHGPGANYTVDTIRPFTVVTQFPADEVGVLQEINRRAAAKYPRRSSSWRTSPRATR